MLDDLQRHYTVGQQFQRPTCPALGLGTAGDGDQLGLLLTVEHLFDARTHLLLALQRRVQSLLYEPLAKVLDRTPADMERLGGMHVRHFQPRPRRIHRQKDVGVANPICRRLARADQLLQTPAFLGLQPNNILLHADPP